jgi:hypothetical protein
VGPGGLKGRCGTETKVGFFSTFLWRFLIPYQLQLLKKVLIRSWPSFQRGSMSMNPGHPLRNLRYGALQLALDMPKAPLLSLPHTFGTSLTPPTSPSAIVDTESALANRRVGVNLSSRPFSRTPPVHEDLYSVYNVCFLRRCKHITKYGGLVSVQAKQPLPLNVLWTMYCQP